MSSLDALRSSGMNVDGLSGDEQAALGRLSGPEVDALIAIRGKLNAEPEVGGFAVKRPVLGDGSFIW